MEGWLFPPTHWLRPFTPVEGYDHTLFLPNEHKGLGNLDPLRVNLGIRVLRHENQERPDPFGKTKGKA